MSRVLIIGGGVAGLSAGIYAARAGHEVTVCEQQRVAGGNLTGWNRKGYHIDNCIHWLTGTNPNSNMYEMWKELGVLGDGIDVYQAEKLYTYEWNGQSLSLYRDLNRTVNEMLTLCPEDAKEIISMRRAIEKVMYLENVGGRNHDQGVTVLRLLQLAPYLLKYHGYTTTTIEKRFKSPLMKGFFTALMGPDFSMAAYIYVASTFCSDNGGIPAGSSRAMADRMTAKLQSYGGVLLTGKKAVKFNIEGRKVVSVTFDDGETLTADTVISTIDPAMLFKKIEKMHMPDFIRKVYRDARWPRFSANHAAFGCSTEKLPFQGTIMYDIPEDRRDLLGGDQLILREFHHEKTFSPEGKSIIQAMVFCREKRAAGLVLLAQRRKEYKIEKERIAETMQALIEEKYPDLKGELELLDTWTPASYARYVGTEIGSFMSFVLPAKQLPKSLKKTFKGLENLILASQWLTPPGGLPIAALQGKDAAAMLDRQK